MDSRPIILVVEDEILIGLAVQDFLEHAGYEVRLVGTAAHALDELESGADAFNALVTDIRLKDGKNGWQIARRARELNALLPVIYVSGDSAMDHASEGVPHSVMIQKPFAAAQIVTAVSVLINKLPPTPCMA